MNGHKQGGEAETSLEEVREAIYQSLREDNEDIDRHIARLKGIMRDQGLKQVAFQADRLVQNNRQGRKMMQSYFKKRGVSVTFE